MQATLTPISASASGEPEGGIELSIVMPCLNEARTVGRCVDLALQSLKSMGIPGEVVVADNGSSDGSQELAVRHGARVIAVQRRGYGSALQAGIAAAHGKYIVMGDADDSYDFGRLEPFVEKLRGGHELVMGNRFQGGIQPGAMPWLHRYVGNPVLSGILNLFFHSPIRDAHCGLRAFRKDAYDRLGLSTTGMEFASEMVVKACLQRQKIAEVPTILRPDGRDRPPHLRSFRDGWRHLRFMLLHCPLWLYLIPALFLLGGGAALMAWLTPGPRVLGGVILDVHTMLFGALAVLLGYQIFWYWACARLFGYTNGMLPAQTWSKRFTDYFFLERGLVIGLILLACGFALNLWLASQWYSNYLGPREVPTTLRLALWGLTSMVLGAQTIFSSFLLSMLRLADRRE
ncbi:MAG TPA: glycosyltransferase family 2 protein [Gemmataceae bacterium]|jgi:glycosyltransferase involved in cell wall biosynthesis|nr:glycosyltransferase family 2 protein [Gemmataceae bacterium]